MTEVASGKGGLQTFRGRTAWESEKIHALKYDVYKDINGCGNLWEK